ncbi:MAG: hypothetical protein LBF97_08185 [Elusimicrobiota bacterium]|nr:hypothetical protein [Elusimicrobiota bacterium]
MKFHILFFEIIKKKYPKTYIAHQLKISYSALLRKFLGKTDFKLQEAIKIKEILGTDMSLEELFRWEEPEGKAKRRKKSKKKINKIESYIRGKL